MRPVDIGIKNLSGIASLKKSFKKNWRFYLQEALGLSIFMVSACFFSGIFFGQHGHYATQFAEPFRRWMLGILMGLTAVFIFYSPWTSPSGSHINPAVTLTFFRLKKMDRPDTFFYIFFQTLGGTLTVYGMAWLMGENLTAAPLYDVVTIPGRYGTLPAAITELIIAFIMMSMILFIADSPAWKKYSRIIAGCLVAVFVFVAGPVSGFGMNPARSFASALPAHIWTAFWIYLFLPVAGMLGAAQIYLWVKHMHGKI